MIRIKAEPHYHAGPTIPVKEMMAPSIAKYLEGAKLQSLKVEFTIRDLKNFEELSDFLAMIKPCFK